MRNFDYIDMGKEIRIFHISSKCIENILQKLGYTRKTTGYYINYEDYKNYISDFPFTSRGPGNE